MNPILSMLSGKKNNQSIISNFKNFINGKNPDALFDELYKNNIDFKNFIDSNKGKTPQQVAKENGVDLTKAL